MRPVGLLALLLGARLALGFAYSLIIPPWEGVDEDAHFAYAQYLATHYQLPRPGDPAAERIRENHQPPLYYILLAPVIKALGAAEVPIAVVRNPYLSLGSGYNYAVQSGSPTAPERAVVNALYAARWVTVLLATASALAVFGTARRIWPQRRLEPLAATAVYAFWPQQLYLTSVVNNDALIMIWAAVVLLAAVSTALRGITWPLGLGLLVGLGAALLTKLNALALVPVVVLAMIGGLARRPARAPRHAWLLVLGCGLLLLGVLFGLRRLAFVGGHVLAPSTVQLFLANTLAQGRLAPWFLLPALAHGLRSFLGEFGWGNIVLPGWLYGLWGLSLVLAILGLCDSAFQPHRRLPGAALWLCLVQVLAAAGMAAALAVAAGDGYLLLGRYMLPALPALAVLWVAGGLALGPQRWSRLGPVTLAATAILTGWSAPWLTLAPAYGRPEPLPPDTPIEHPLALRYAGGMELAGYQEVAPTQHPGEVVVTLCWRAHAPLSENYTVLLEALAPDGQALGARATYPGNGNYATTQWRVGELFCEPYPVRAFAADRPMLPTTLQVSVLTEPDRQRLPPYTASGVAYAQPVHIPVP